ncbi:MAG: hypothetical protein BGN98_06205 [Microbacterium sp. 69-7]|uniref:Lipoprotein n=3 Tax=Microbacteriaceae TaxID=85023 RepID=A0A150HJI5_9MICO|nr:hypothetical protein Mlaev_00087 [Microbacterium laevaniformans]ODT23788.1 MAG: hypothetical protein ABS64_08420 [Microbacterium sp. SCN 69-37]OJU47728.1 MAG: hypothetical protein BGN98_06205 [Microbacterium sp. 69-7]
MSRNRLWHAMAATAVLALILTGCSGMNEKDVSDRLGREAGLNGALVEVQHPGLPTNEKIVVWMFVDDTSAPAVADDVTRVARVAANDPDLAGKDLTLAAVEGSPADHTDRVVLGSSGVPVMAAVAETVGGRGAEEFLELSAADVRRLAGRQ